MISIWVWSLIPRGLGHNAYDCRSFFTRAHTRIQTPDSGTLQMLLAATKGTTSPQRFIYDRLTSSDALLRVSLRAIVHGPIRSDFADPRTFTEVGRLCGPRIRQLREEPGHANIAENQ